MKTSLLVRSRLLGGRFSPQTLFALSEPGVWYDPSDLTTMFTDTAGTTPATIGSAVALLLDKSKGLVLGPELSVESGVVYRDNVLPSLSFQTGATVTAGRTYLISYTIASSGSTSSASWRINAIGGQINLPNVASGFNGSVTGKFLATSTGPLSLNADNATVNLTVTGASVKELPGNHATQATTAARPILGRVPSVGRRNLLTWSEDFSNAEWLKLNAGTGVAPVVTANAGTAPDGTTTADRIVFNRGAGTTNADVSRIFREVPDPATGVSTNSVYLRSFDGVSTYSLQIINGVDTTDVVTVTGTWQRFSVSSPGTTTNFQIRARGDTTQQTADVLVWGAQGEHGSTATAYQRVGSTFDVTEAGQPDNYYLSFDGVDDSMVTPTITPGVDKVQVFAGVRKLSDAARGTIVEHSATIDSNNGAFHLTAPNAASATFGFESKGTTLTDAVASATAPITSVLTGLGDIAGDTATIRVNGAQQDQDTNDQGTGNYLAYPLYIGRRGGTTLPLNGQIFSLIVRFGANLNAGTISSTEKWVSGKTAGVTL